MKNTFANWRDQFCERASEKGIRRSVLWNALPTDSFIPEVLEQQANQKEFLLTIGAYLEKTLSPNRVKKGRKNLRIHRQLFADIEMKFRVPAPVILAFWGMETAFGTIRGAYNVPKALATLAYAGDRRGFFEQELMSALFILQNGDISAAQMTGSWAGAMGHGQFMPSSYLRFAIDYDGDGRRDIWRDQPDDALASIANYLVKHGWRNGQPWGLCITLPEGFDVSLTGRDQPREVAEWTALGVRALRGTHLIDYGPASIILPEGVGGPAMMVFRNFDVIMKYNNSVNYALALGLLTDRIGGNKALKISWDCTQKILARPEIRELQQRLTDLGFDAGGADGLYGSNTTKAIRGYQISRGIPADGYPHGPLLDGLRAIEI